jgi:hypothetical protein
MSSAALRAATQDVVKSAAKKNRRGTNLQARSDAQRARGQIFVINREEEASLITKVTGVVLTEQEKIDLFGQLTAHLEMLEGRSRLDATEKENLIKIKNKAKKEPGDAAFVLLSFSSAKDAKFLSKSKYKPEKNTDLSTIKANFVNKLSRRKRDFTREEMSKASDIGHGGRGIAVSQFALEREIDAAAEKHGLSTSEKSELYNIVLEQRKKHNIEIAAFHKQEVSLKKLGKKFTFVLTNQDKESNIEDSHIEKSAFKESLRQIDILGQQTSTSLKDAVNQVVLEELAPKGSKVKGKRRKRVNESSKATTRSSEQTKEKVNYKVQRGAPMKGAKAPTRRSRFSGVKLLALLNQKLPSTVADNMGAPRLENRSGRFAASVRATDVIKTPQGFPSIGYTYQKNPYQTFETGYAQGSQERDPRTLINMSIREIAMEMAVGRFYTRRV